jgi:beta-lactam-binding protein with PASTA domain
MSIPYIEGQSVSNPPVASFTLGSMSASNTSLTAFVTALSNLALCVIVHTHNSTSVIGPMYITSVTSPNLSWGSAPIFRVESNNVNNGLSIEFWAAPISAPLSGEIVTVTSNAPVDAVGFALYGVVGAGLFDLGGGTLPVGVVPAGTSPLTVPSYNTTDADTLVVALSAVQSGATQTAPTGFSNLPYQPFGSGLNLAIATPATYAPGTIVTGGSIVSALSGTSGVANTALLAFGIQGIIATTVPDVVGDTDTAARAAIAAASLIVGTVTSISGGTPGVVAAQSPVGGTPVSSGSAVDLVEYEGDVVPNIIDTSLAVVAPGILAAAGLVVGIVSYQASGVIIAGNVISQSPTAGSFVSAGSAVNLVVSSGLPALTVPDLFGLSRTDAINALIAVGLVPGAIGSAPSQFVPPGEVQAQNPSAGIAVAVGSIVSFVLSLGTPAVGTLFDFEATVISQYANSPTILQLVQNLNQYVDQSTNFANFFNFVWNVDTAVDFGLDIWGKIVGVSRLLQIPNTTDYVGFDNGTRSPPDWQSMGSDQPPYNDPPVGGALYTGFNATSTYLLGNDAYRQLILAKAFANICATTAPAINTILQNLYGPGTAWVLNTGPMAISYNLTFTPSAIQLAILQQSGVIPTPPGVSVTINTNV